MTRLLAAVTFALALAAPTPSDAWLVDQTGLSHDMVVDPSGDVFVVGATSRFVVHKLSGLDGTELWRADDEVFFDPNSSNSKVAAFGGDAIAVGQIEASGGGAEFITVRLDGATGAELWRHVAEQIGGLATSATDVFIGGRVANATGDGFVARLDGLTGAEVWRTDIDGGFEDDIRAVALDPSGDVLVTGRSATGPAAAADRSAFVAKLDATTGTELWRVTVTGPGPAGNDDDLVALAADSSGDVIAVGVLRHASSPSTVAPVAVKLDAATGSELWRHVAGGGITVGSTLAVDLDASDDVLVAGSISDAVTGSDGYLAKLDGTSGVPAWELQLDGRRSADFFLDVEVDGAGHPVAVGWLGQNKGFAQFVAVAVDGSTGDEIWRQPIDTPEGGGRDVAIDPAGDILATARGFVTMKLDRATGIVGPIPGRKLQVLDATLPAARSITAKLRGIEIVAPPSGSAGDPTLHGGSLLLENPITTESASFALPAAGWKGLGSPPGAKGYLYSDKNVPSAGACRKVKVVPSKTIVAACSGKRGPIAFTLDEAQQEQLSISLRLGSTPPQCGVFGGTVKKDTGVGQPSARGQFKATDAPGEGSCP